jgi:hypothetical protein
MRFDALRHVECWWECGSFGSFVMARFGKPDLGSVRWGSYG